MCELRQCQVVGTNALVHNNYKQYKCQYMCLCVSGFLFECSFCCLNVWFFWHCLVPSKLNPLSKGVPAWMQMPLHILLPKEVYSQRFFLSEPGQCHACVSDQISYILFTQRTCKQSCHRCRMCSCFPVHAWHCPVASQKDPLPKGVPAQQPSANRA